MNAAFFKEQRGGRLAVFMGAGRRGAGVAAGELPYLRRAAQAPEERAAAGDPRSRGAAWAVSVALMEELGGGTGPTALDPLGSRGFGQEYSLGGWAGC
jgi:hypothetical protein